NNLFQNTSIGGGGIKITLEDGKIEKTDGSLEVFVKKAIIIIKIKSWLRMNIGLQVLALQHAKVNIYQIKQSISKINTKKVFSKTANLANAIEDNWDLFETLSNKEDVIFNDIFLNFYDKNKNKTELYIDKVNFNYQTKARKGITKYLTKEHKSVHIATSVLTNNILHKVNASCKKRDFGRLCKFRITNLNGKFLNMALRPNNVQIIDLEPLMFDLQLEFGSHLPTSNINMFCYTYPKSYVKTWLDNGFSFRINPTVLPVVVNTDKHEISLKPSVIGVKSFGVSKFGFKIRFVKDKSNKFFFWNSRDIDAKNVSTLLKLISVINSSIDTAMNGILENISINKGSVNVKTVTITSLIDKPVKVDMVITTDDVDLNINPLNSLLLKNVQSTIMVLSNKTTVKLQNFKIGNQLFSNGSVDVKYSNTDLPPSMNIELLGKKVDLMEMITNPSMPPYAQKIAKFLDINKGSVLSGQINSKIIFPKGKFNIINHFAYKSDMKVDNLKGAFLTSSVPIKIVTKKQLKEKDLKVTMDLTKLAINIGDKVIVKNSEEEMQGNFTMVDIFTQQIDEKNKEDKKHRGYRYEHKQRKQTKILFKDVKLYNDRAKKLFLDAEIDTITGDTFLESTFVARIKKMNLLNSDLYGKIVKKSGRNYKFNIIGSQANWPNIFNIYRFIGKNSNDSNFYATTINGYMGIDKITMFNNVEAIDLHLKSIIKKSVFKDVQLSMGLQRHIGVENDTILEQIVSKITKTTEIINISPAQQNNSKNNEKTHTEMQKNTISACADITKDDTGNVGVFVKMFKDSQKNESYLYTEDAKLLFEGFDVVTSFSQKISGLPLSIRGLQIDPMDIIKRSKKDRNEKNTKNVIRGVAYATKPFCYYSDTKKDLRVDKFTFPFDININSGVLKLRDFSIKTNLITMKGFGYFDFPENTVYINGKLHLPKKKAAQKEILNSDIPIIGKAMSTSLSGKEPSAVLSFTIDGPIDSIDENISMKPSRYLLFLSSLGGIGVFGVILLCITFL
ncbi:MAG: hypothetical protein JJW01_03000, partial [Alphaproteobacteria bacterium]|nr:hypothetical protein [Rickettsiales bacterium]